MKNQLFLSVAAFLMGVSNGMAGTDKMAWISETRSEGRVTLEVFVNLPKGETGHYEFEARKSGVSGSTVNRQAGRVEGGRTSPVSTSHISFGSKDRLTAKLTLTLANGDQIEEVVEVNNHQVK